MISIIIPIYNAEKFLHRCIDGVLEQTYTDFELILVDDGSIDESLNICNKFAEYDNRIKVITKKNEGQGIARNVGISNSTSKYITFIDSDDFIGKNYLLYLINEILDNDIDMVIGGYNKVNYSECIVYSEKYTKQILGSTEVGRKMLGSLPDSDDGIKSTVWNTLYKADIIKNNKIKFLSERKIFSEDTFFNIEYLKNVNLVRLIDSVEYNYFMNENSTTMKYDINKLKNINNYDKYLKKEFNDKESRLRINRNYIFNIKKCIQQEKNNIKNKNFFSLFFSIKKITHLQQVHKNFSNYPLKKLNNNKAKIFFYLIKYKLNFLLAIVVFLSLGKDKKFKI